VLTLNPAIAIAGRDAVKESGKEANLATFDLNADVVKAIKAKEISFAVDQQQYLQGYLPVVFLALYGRNANTVGGGQPVYTGPGFVTEENADTVEKLAGAGTR
jgi:simple sugar transport system substrate-binding protein